MLHIKKAAIAGSLESSDVQIRIEPCQAGIDIVLESVVKMQYGDAILETVRDVIERFQVNSARITINDKGAIDAVIRARMHSAICRAAEIRYDWAQEDSYGR